MYCAEEIITIACGCGCTEYRGPSGQMLEYVPCTYHQVCFEIPAFEGETTEQYEARVQETMAKLTVTFIPEIETEALPF